MVTGASEKPMIGKSKESITLVCSTKISSRSFSNSIQIKRIKIIFDQREIFIQKNHF